MKANNGGKIVRLLITLAVLGLAVAPAFADFAGPLVGWGRDDFSQAAVPFDTNFTAVAAGSNHNVAVIPEPATLILLGAGLLGLAGYANKKKKIG